ncbi:uncharacterized protein PGTG_10506 [Puccinia graminis f. sp. tritici CRL 75-36-700-3]|uniref:Uncharacterized protein n=1 Tax=Puccinia graminis f. sp. tritici (strain CRL 75-36-700-3 / race SCCL) TaxID=418459 RepID=E3KIK3_PUCGT|nr:uncharacterized protein PGTG_10506 [Puccinia graminis f. sp. tritici CRL 75-36-700-3]EFP84128.1 hypothetical protein PGTG_10506 [Puccinia graminis f. sp. tritici CRL 75-36-700-3]
MANSSLSNQTMRASMRAFGDDFQPEVTHLVKTGWTDSQIREHIKATYDISVSQRTLTCRKEDWGLILQAAEYAAQLEDCFQGEDFFNSLGISLLTTIYINKCINT